jgi:hypothetical protein
MTEREGTAADFAAMLGLQPPDGSGSDQHEDTGPDAEQRRAIAERHGLAPEMGERLYGNTAAELNADAAAVASLRPTEPQVNAGEIEALAQMAAKEQRVSASELFGLKEED